MSMLHCENQKKRELVFSFDNLKCIQLVNSVHQIHWIQICCSHRPVNTFNVFNDFNVLTIFSAILTEQKTIKDLSCLKSYFHLPVVSKGQQVIYLTNGRGTIKKNSRKWCIISSGKEYFFSRKRVSDLRKCKTAIILDVMLLRISW